jgi:hypothetical protein
MNGCHTSTSEKNIDMADFVAKFDEIEKIYSEEEQKCSYYFMMICYSSQRI